MAKDQVEERVQVRLRRVSSTPARASLDRRLDQRRPGQRAERAVRASSPSGRRARRTDAPPTWNSWVAAAEVHVDRLHFGPRRRLEPEPGQRDEEVEQARRAVARAVDEHEAAAAGAGERALRHPGGEGGGDAGVDRVATLGQDGGPGSAVSGCPAAMAPFMGEG